MKVASRTPPALAAEGNVTSFTHGYVLPRNPSACELPVVRMAAGSFTGAASWLRRFGLT